MASYERTEKRTLPVYCVKICLNFYGFSRADDDELLLMKFGWLTNDVRRSKLLANLLRKRWSISTEDVRNRQRVYFLISILNQVSYIFYVTTLETSNSKKYLEL